MWVCTCTNSLSSSSQLQGFARVCDILWYHTFTQIQCLRTQTQADKVGVEDNSLPLCSRDFYKLWKLLWTKLQQNKTTQLSAMSSLYQRKTKCFLLFSSAECQRGYQTPKNKYKTAKTRRDHLHEKLLLTVLVLNCRKNNLWKQSQTTAISDWK